MKTNINYYEQYFLKKIKLKKIPISKLNVEILRLGAINEPSAFVDVVLNLYKVYKSVDLIKFVSFLNPDSFECYFMYDQIFMIDPVKYFDLIPDKYRNGKMWNRMLEINRDKYFDLIPQQYRTRDLVYEMLKINPIKYFNGVQKYFYDKEKNRPVYISLDEQAKINKIIFDSNPEKIWEYLVNNELMFIVNQDMCNRMIEIDPVRYFNDIPDKFVTANMCKKIYNISPEKLFRVVGFNLRDNLEWNSLLTPFMCLKLIEINSKKFFNEANSSYIKKVFYYDPKKYFSKIPYEKRDIFIYEKMYELDSDKYFSLIPVSYVTEKMSNEMFERDPVKYFEMLPERYRTIDKCIKMFTIDAERYFKLFPSYNMTLDMCEEMFKKDVSYFCYFPDEFKTLNMCKKMVDIDILKYFEYIPLFARTQEMYTKLFNIDPDKYFNDIPNDYRTLDMWNFMYNKNPNEIFVIMPDIYKNQEMCIKYFELNHNNFYEYIPHKFLTKEMLIVLLKKDFYQYIDLIRDDMIDIDIISIAKLELDKIRCDGRYIYKEDMPKLFNMVIQLYPEYNNLVYKTVDDKIRDELYLLITLGGTIEFIAEKYNVDVTYVNLVLEKIKDVDLNNYLAIKDVLETNQRNYFINMMNDIRKLIIIINSIGNIDRQGINVQQKIKFAYLCNKYLHNKLEEIYNFNYSKYSKQDTIVITKFFNHVLKYNYIFNNDLVVPEKKTIQFNNSWLRDYNRYNFFAIKNGISTLERRYGKNSELLTLEIEEKIINILKMERIPLNEIIVMNAFKEYFNGNLVAYINTLKEYDDEFTFAMKSISKG